VTVSRINPCNCLESSKRSDCASNSPRAERWLDASLPTVLEL
jgi:hypothetical protein